MIQVTHIKKKYGKKVVLEDVTFAVNPGECVAIIGENGCGKSTLLKFMAGVMNADAGEFSYYGKKKNKNKLCGYVPQENPLLEDLSVKDNLFLWGGKTVMNQKEVLEEFQLMELLDTPVKKLSGGMKRRLSIACSMLKMPSILLLDEPTAGLDLFYKEQILAWIKSYQEKNGMVIIVTHEEQEILSADRCLLMEAGKMIELKKEDLSEDKIREIIYRKYM